MYFRNLSALAFAADFPPVAPEFHQRTRRVRLRNLGTTGKKSSHKIKHRKTPRVHHILSIICVVWVVCGKTGGIMHGKKKQYFRCLQQFRKKYSGTAVVSLVAPFTEDCGLFRDRTKRSYPVRHGFRCSNRKKY